MIELGVTSDEVEVEILEKAPSGLFGLFSSKQARVKVTKKSNLADVAAEFLKNVFVKWNLMYKLRLKLMKRIIWILNSAEKYGRSYW